jgi:NADPH:quinone reductase-like Zn-dependent oxidoreductase
MYARREEPMSDVATYDVRAVQAATEVEGSEAMKAVVVDGYGPKHVHVREVARPEVADDELLVRVRASSLNRIEWYGASGTPYLTRPMQGVRKPKDPRLGIDFAGTVAAVGRDVREFRTGDAIFGRAAGALAEYVCVSASDREGFAERQASARIPEGVTFEEAAALPVAGITALQGLRDHGGLQAGQRVLVNGASGGVGTFAVQVAKALGAEVTAVCSTGKVELVRSLGADHVVDYTREDFTRSSRRYDILFDVAGGRSWRATTRVLEREGTVVLVGGPKRNMLGPLAHIAKFLIAGKLSSRKVVFFLAKINRPDLETLADLVVAGKVRSVVERTYPLSETAEALRYIGEGHACGKVVITV